jgi:hypothetical protein
MDASYLAQKYEGNHLAPKFMFEADSSLLPALQKELLTWIPGEMRKRSRHSRSRRQRCVNLLYVADSINRNLRRNKGLPQARLSNF